MKKNNTSLPTGFILRVQQYKEVLKEVETTSLEEAISNFQKDTNPENELIIWENIAKRYKLSLKNNPRWTVEDKRKELGRLLFAL